MTTPRDARAGHLPPAWMTVARCRAGATRTWIAIDHATGATQVFASDPIHIADG